ncbi:hypothetical protein [Streptomyces sp. NPDC002785]|uniref:vWA-MoxR associated conflict system protein n=1 Tax=Streptomyces sp. NPDC002785 TaxID=3154543 RepID=UPI00331CD56C
MAGLVPQQRRTWCARVTHVVATLIECAKTVVLFNTLLADVLTRDLLREARQLAGLPHESLSGGRLVTLR